MLFTLNLSQPRFTNEPCRRLWALRGRCRNSRRSRGGFLRSLGSNLLRGLPGSLHRRFLRGGWLSGLGRRGSFSSHPGPTSAGGLPRRSNEGTRLSSLQEILGVYAWSRRRSRAKEIVTGQHLSHASVAGVSRQMAESWTFVGVSGGVDDLPVNVERH